MDEQNPDTQGTDRSEERGRLSLVTLVQLVTILARHWVDCWYAGALGHFGVDFCGRLFEVVGTTAG